MNFQERFKGKTSTISKEGLESVVSSSNTPVRKPLGSTQSIQQSSYSTPSSDFLSNPEHTPKFHARSGLMPLSSTSNLHAPSLMDASTPKDNTYSSMGYIKSFQSVPVDSERRQMSRPRMNTMAEQAAESTRSTSILGGYTDKQFLLRSLNGQIARSANHSQINHSDSMQFNPNSFYNQHSQLNTPNQSSKGSILKALDDLPTKQNINHIHKRNFENLAQQNKDRKVARNTDLIIPSYGQQYRQQQMEINEVKSATLKRGPGIIDDKRGSNSPVRAVNHNRMDDNPRMGNQGDDKLRKMESWSVGFNKPETLQSIVLNKVQSSDQGKKKDNFGKQLSMMGPNPVSERSSAFGGSEVVYPVNQGMGMHSKKSMSVGNFQAEKINIKSKAQY